MKIYYRFDDDHYEESSGFIERGELRIPAAHIPSGVRSVEIHDALFSAGSGTKGYYVVPNTKYQKKGNNMHSALIEFRARHDMEYTFRDHIMPMFAICRKKYGVLAVVSGMQFDYELVCGVKDGTYYLYPKFVLPSSGMYEDIVISYISLNGQDADYSGVARQYRKYQLDSGACRPIIERKEEYPVLAEAADCPMVRLRLGWKEVPPPVLEQTEDNEPPMHTAITFSRAGEILDEFHRQGIEKAEFCLVGWNKSGHDGRYPDLFPVEPLLGGEAELIRLVKKANDYGYLITAHTNPWYAFSIAKRWNKEYLITDQKGDYLDGWRWGGGQAYLLCPKMAHEHFALSDFKDIARFGFRGIHYLDVISIVPPDECLSKDHALNRREAGAWRGKTLALARETIGGSGSEGPWDFCIGDLDYVLYVIFNPDQKLPDICDRIVPLWHMVYHGIVLYNSTCGTVNTAINPDRNAWLTNVEYGGRPLVYFYSQFLSSGTHWMGAIDCSCETDERLRECVSRIKEEYDEYKRIRDLQFHFIQEHAEIDDRIIRVVYQNSSVIIINYREEAYNYHGTTIAPKSFSRLDE